MSNEAPDQSSFVQKGIAEVWAKLRQADPASSDSIGLLWELSLLKSSVTGCNEPVHEIDGVLQPDFDEIRRRQEQIEHRLFGDQS